MMRAFLAPLAMLARRAWAPADARDRRLHLGLVLLLLVGVFAFHGALCYHKRYWPFGHDFANFATVGRGFIEYGQLPTFLFPGKTFDGPTKPVSVFYPGLIFGFHETLLYIMPALTQCLLAAAFYLMACWAVSPGAGLLALILCSLQDPQITGYVYQPAYGFDVIVLLSALTGCLGMYWARRARQTGRQPAAPWVFLTGAAAGLAWYTQPTAAACTMAVGLFLILLLGARVLTWRIPLAAAGFLFGSLPFWLYLGRHHRVLHSWFQYSGEYEHGLSVTQCLFSPAGYLRYALAPGRGRTMTVFLALSVVLTVGVAAGQFLRFIRSASRPRLARCLRTGLPLGAGAYCLCHALALLTVSLATAGMSQASAKWAYGIELWYWFMLAGVFALTLLIRRCAPIGLLLFAGLALHFGVTTWRGVPPLTKSMARHKEMVTDDAAAMLADGHDNVLIDNHRHYLNCVYAPERLNMAHQYKPWVRVMAAQVEQSRAPAIIGNLPPETLGHDAWQTTRYQLSTLHHDFRAPPSGRLIPNEAWTIHCHPQEDDSRGQLTEPDLTLLRDDTFTTAWQDDTEAPVSLKIVFDQPRAVCRLCIYLHRERKGWHGSVCPGPLEIRGMQPDGQWVTLTTNAYETGYSWAGGRPFYCAYRRRFDVSFPATTIQQLHLREPVRGGRIRRRKIHELYLFETCAESDTTSDAQLDALAAFVRECKAAVFLGDRFVSAQIHKRCPRTGVWAQSHNDPTSPLMERYDHWPWSTDFESFPAAARPGRRHGGMTSQPHLTTVMAVETAFAATVDRILAQEGLKAQRREFGAYTVYAVAASDNVPPCDLVWNGTCLGYLPSKANAHAWLESRRAHPAAGKAEDLARLRRIVGTFPLYHDAWQQLCTLEPEVIADTAWQEYRLPETWLAAPIRFENNVELVAVDITPKIVTPGSDVRIRYVWRLPQRWTEAEVARPNAFAHIVTDSLLINDDHRLLDNYPQTSLMDTFSGEVFIEPRTVHVPVGAPPGRYELEIGLYRGERRFRIKTRNPEIRIHRRAAFLPAFNVTCPGPGDSPEARRRPSQTQPDIES